MQVLKRRIYVAVDSLEKAKTISDSVTFVNTLQLPFEADDLAERVSLPSLPFTGSVLITYHHFVK